MVIAATVRADGRTEGKLVEVRLVVNPATDLEFARRAEELAGTVTNPEDMERLLRGVYDQARVVRGVTDITDRWYVYRDGCWVSTPERST